MSRADRVSGKKKIALRLPGRLGFFLDYENQPENMLMPCTNFVEA